MEQGAISSAAGPGSGTAFSAWSLFVDADIVVKIVMLGLLGVSLWSWSIIIGKWLRFREVKAQADAFEDKFWSGTSLDKLFDGEGGKPGHPFAMVFIAAMNEWRRSVVAGSKIDKASVRQRLHTVMRVTFERELDRLEGSLNFLATVGSVSPFVGLFGTVWGIMRAFFNITTAQNTSLAVVAPGIAEALFATAIGLFAAIPAVIGYNKLQADAARFGNRLSAFCDEFSAILSRQLDDRAD